jgi:hypothetical protein
MSQQTRRILAAVGLAASLLLAVPAPSRAASFREPSLAAGVVERAWSWLRGLMPALSASVDKDGPSPVVRTGTTSQPVAPPPAPTDEQGSMIDPDGKP